MNKLDDLLRSKSYQELTEEQKFWIDNELGGEEAYSRLRGIVTSSASELHMEVDSSVKQSLMRQIKMKNQSHIGRIFNFKVPAYLTLIVVLFSLAFVLLAEPETKVVEKIVEIPSQPVIDTLYIETRADTVYIERTKEVPVYLTLETEKEQNIENPIPPLAGKSLADQEEIRKLLVRLD